MNTQTDTQTPRRSMIAPAVLASLFGVAMTGALAGCEQESDPADAIGDAADDAADAVDDAADEVQDAVEDAGDAVEDATDGG